MGYFHFSSIFPKWVTYPGAEHPHYILHLVVFKLYSTTLQTGSLVEKMKNNLSIPPFKTITLSSLYPYLSFLPFTTTVTFTIFVCEYNKHHGIKNYLDTFLITYYNTNIWT